MTEFLFFFSLIVIAYTYVGYPLLLVFMSSISAKTAKKREFYPSVSVIVYACDEGKNIEAKISELLGIDYPRDKLEIIVGYDGASNEIYQLLKRYSDQNQTRYAVSFQITGKPAMINKMVKDARGDVFVFIDARQKLERASIKKLMRSFADADVGAACGDLIYQGIGAKSGKFRHWYEQKIRKMHSDLGSMMSSYGAVYAIRKEFFRYLPENTILEDSHILMGALVVNKVVVFEPEAVSYASASGSLEKEVAHKSAMFVSNMQVYREFSETVNPLNKIFITIRLVSYNLLRPLMPFFYIVACLTGIILLFSRIPVAGAQVTPAEVQRTQEITEQELKLRDRIEQERKYFVKKVVIEGADLLTEEEKAQKIVLLANKWISRDDIQQVLTDLEALYKGKGCQDRLYGINYNIRNNILTIFVAERDTLDSKEE